MITCRATLDVPAELLRFVTRLLILERWRRGTPPGSRALACRGQAILVLRRFRDRTRIDQLGRDHGVSRATAYRYVGEGTEVLAAQAPDGARRPDSSISSRWSSATGWLENSWTFRRDRIASQVCMRESLTD